MKLWPLSAKFSHIRSAIGRTYDLIRRGAYPVVASKALGHASLSSILVYYHPTEKDLRKALQG